LVKKKRIDYSDGRMALYGTTLSIVRTRGLWTQRWENVILWLLRAVRFLG